MKTSKRKPGRDTITLCKNSGQLARAECPEKEEKRLKKGDVPREPCSIHIPQPAPKVPVYFQTRRLGRADWRGNS